MSKDRHNPEKIAAEEKARIETGRKTFDESGIVELVKGIKDSLPEGTSISNEVNYEGGGLPALIITTPKVDGTDITHVGGLTGHFVDVPAKVSSRLIISPAIEHLEYYVYEEKVREDGGRSGVLKGSGSTWIPSNPEFVRHGLYDGLARTFDFTPEQDQQIRKALSVEPWV